MLDIMRRKKRLRAVLWLVIISLGLGMLLFFVPGANVGSGSIDTSAASVDGNPISLKEYATTYRRMVENYSAGGRNKTDAATLKALGLGRQALDALINVKVVEYAAKRLGLDVTPDEVRRAIQSNPNLQDRGVFIGPERYRALLAANNLTVTEFEEGMRNMLLSGKIRAVVADSMDVSEQDVREEFSRSSQEAQVQYVLLKKDDFKAKVKPSEPELRAYFDGHKDKYHIKEQRRAQYLLVSMSALAPTLTVSEQEIQDEWAKQEHQETVDAAHILFAVKDPAKDAEVRAKAESVLKQLKAGADFAQLAKKYSDDPGSANEGGNLGPFPRGRMVKEFDNVAFALKPGEISDLVKTQFGYHIIKVLRHDNPSLEANRPMLMRAAQLDKASDLAKRKAAEAESLAKSDKDLNSVAKKLGVPAEVRETQFLDRNTDPYAAGISQQMVDEVFRLKEVNAVGRVVDDPQGYAIPKLLETRLPKPPDFNESKAAVEKDYIDSKAGELMDAAAKTLSQEATASGSLEAAAKKSGFTVKTTGTFKRDAAADPDIGPSPQFNTAAFETAVGAVSAPVQVEPGTKVAVLQVKTRSPFDEEAYKKQREDIRARLVGMWQEPYFQEYIRRVTEALEKSGKIRVNKNAVDQVASIY